MRKPGIPGIQREVARRQGSPCTGKLSARPAGKPGDFFIVKGEFATFPSSPLGSRSQINTEAPQYAFSKGMSESIWSDGVSNRNQTLGQDRAASRRSAPSPGKRTRREDHAPSHRPQMSSGRLFLDRVARQHCPSPLHRRPQNNMHSAEGQAKHDISTLLGTRHFYFALTVCPIEFDMLYSFCYHPWPRWSMGKPAIFFFTVLPGKEYLDVHQ